MPTVNEEKTVFLCSMGFVFAIYDTVDSFVFLSRVLP